MYDEFRSLAVEDAKHGYRLVFDSKLFSILEIPVGSKKVKTHFGLEIPQFEWRN